MSSLQRSQFVQVFNNSPAETAYFRMVLNRSNVANSLVMIQPYLSHRSHSCFDVTAIAVDWIVLLDAYFSVAVSHGMTIVQWRNAGYQNQPKHEAFAQLLDHRSASWLSFEEDFESYTGQIVIAPAWTLMLGYDGWLTNSVFCKGPSLRWVFSRHVRELFLNVAWHSVHV